jgi:rhamnosyl/mannosyltransferase
LARAIREFGPNLLHLHVPNTSAFWALLVPAARRLPWVLHWHADVVPSQLDRRLAVAYRAYRPLEERLIKASRAVIVTSPDYLASSNALADWKAKCHVIPLGLDPTRLGDPNGNALTLANRHWGNATFRILVVGRLTYFKGHDTLIQAISDVPGARVIIVGEGERRQSLERLIETLRLASRVDLAGSRGWESADPDLAALFHTCDVVCLPSLERTESFGLVLLEAMRYEKPVVTTSVPGSGIGWVVSEGEHGVLVAPGDPAALAQALRDLSSDPVRRQRLGQQGGRRLDDRFHIDRVAQSIDALYRQLAPNCDGPVDHSDGAAAGGRNHPKPSCSNRNT